MTAGTVDTPTATGRARRPATHSRTGWWKRCVPSRLALVIVAFTCVVVPVSLVVVHIHENPELSPIDEAAHWDYVTRLADGGFPRLGQRLQPSTLGAIECQRVALHGLVIPPCGTPPDTKRFGNDSYQYEAQQPPGYYALTVPMRWFGMNALGLADLTATRLTGLVWLVSSLLLFWIAGRLMDLSPPVLGAGTLLIATAPLTISLYSSVTNDVTTLFAGSLVMVLGALALKHPGRWMTPVMLLAGVAIASFKLSDLLPVVVASFLLGALAIRPGAHREGREGGLVAALRWWWPRGGAILVGALAGAVAWLVVEHRLATIDPKELPSFDVLRTVHVTFSLIMTEALTLFQPLTDSYDIFRTTDHALPRSSATSLHLQSVMATVLGYVVVAGGLAGLFVRRREWFHWLGLTTLPALYLGGMVLGVSAYLTYNTDPSLSGRYGMALAPMLLVALVASVRGAWALGGLWVLGTITFGLSFYFLLG
jgi:hypothetical protein